MGYNEEDFLKISGIQHYVFCRRQWALIHIEGQWAENFRTTDGRIMHSSVHDSGFNEKRKDVIITRAMAVSSAELGLSGECDVVEFHKSENGTEIFGREGKYTVVPVEYKRGVPKVNSCDRLQLAAQAMCLEEMLCCEISAGYLFYGETRHREKVEIDEDIRWELKETVREMHELFERGHTPKPKRTKSCNACSLADICLPAISAYYVSEYISEMLKAGGE